jgi:hypothetical protein
MSSIEERNKGRYAGRPDLHYLELLMLRVKEYNDASDAYLRNKTIDTNRKRMFAAKDRLDKALHFLRKRGYEFYVEDKPVKQQLPFQ